MAGSSRALVRQGPGRRGPYGTWWTASTVEGTLRGVMRLDPKLAAAPGAADRVAELIVRLRALGPDRVLRTADLVADAGHYWLITEAPPMPTVADLFGSRLGLGAAVSVLLDTGNALRDLLSAGIGHGRLVPETVIVTQSGAVRLVEAGLGNALTGAVPDPWSDLAGWAALVDVVTAAWCPGPAGDRISAAVGSTQRGRGDSAEALLATALAGIVTATENEPGSADRSALIAAVAPATAAGSVERGEAGPSALARTLLPAPSPTDHPAEAGSDEATRLGQRSPQRGAPDGTVTGATIRLRFGPGVPARPPVPGRSAAARPDRRRRARGFLSALVTVLLVGGAIAWLRTREPMLATAEAVTVAAAPGGRCDVTVDVVGAVQTNGQPGVFSYQWVRNDGQVSAVLGQSVRSGEKVVYVHLYWTFRGQGSYRAQVTLRILQPSPSQAATEFDYSCPDH